jgi:1-phosphatidylinositol phosphodiesterase
MEKTVKKHAIIAVSISSVLLLGTILSFLKFPLTTNTKNATWMSNISDTTPLAALSIPGSHDSAAFYSVGDLAGKCQDAAIAEQLAYGVRFFDIRLKNVKDSLYVYHGFINEGMAFSDLLSPMYSFLSANSSEGLILSIKEEADASKATLSFEALLKKEIALHSERWITAGVLPSTLSSIRGKMVLLSRYNNCTIGIDASKNAGWLDPDSADSANTFTLPSTKIQIQDHYKLNDFDTKWSEAIALINATKSAATPPWVLNFFSGYLVKGFPPSYSVPTAKYINAKILKEFPADAHGISICDFVNEKLVAKILEANV